MNEFVSGNTDGTDADPGLKLRPEAAESAADGSDAQAEGAEDTAKLTATDEVAEAVTPDEVVAPAERDALAESDASGEAEAGDGVGDGAVDLAALIAQRDAYLADLQRVTAEFSNFKRQTAKRNIDVKAQAASGLAEKMLVVLDACEAAVSQGVVGIEPLQSQLLGVLSAEGLTQLGQADEPFDPEFHEAVATEPASNEAQPVKLVAEVFQTGYAWKGRVLRPAMVKVRG